MSIASRLDGLQRRHRQAGFPIAVVYKYVDDSGAYLAALITYYAFVSLFPLLLLFTTVLGFLLAGDPGLQHRIESSALSQFPVVGAQLGQPHSIGGGVVGLVVGILGALYGGLGVAQAAQYAMNTAWAIPRNDRPNPLKTRARSLLLLCTAGLAVVGTTVLSTLGTSGAGSFGIAVKVVALIASVLINTAVFVFAFRIATARSLTVRDVAPGAIAAAIAWQLLQTFGVAYVSHVVKNASATNSVFALVLGLLAFLYLTSVLVVLSVEINVVRVKRLYPRALLTPFTDDVSLTGGDERAYTGQAEAQRAKGFQDIDVSFHPHPHDGDEREGDEREGRTIMTEGLHWRAVVNAVLYIVQFQPALDSESAVKATADQLQTRPLFGEPVEATVAALRDALASDEQLTGPIPQPHDDASVRAFLTRLVDRLDR